MTKKCNLCGRRIGSLGFASHWAGHTRRIEYAKTITEKRCDGDGNWYWIPKVLLPAFDNRLAKLIGKEYAEDPDIFNHFTLSYQKYRTLGDENRCPRIFWEIPNLKLWR